jgi:hypothetical protein
MTVLPRWRSSLMFSLRGGQAGQAKSMALASFGSQAFGIRSVARCLLAARLLNCVWLPTVSAGFGPRFRDWVSWLCTALVACIHW